MVPVGPGNPRSRIGLRHGAVDGKPPGLAHLFQKRCFDSLFPRRQDQFQIRGTTRCRPVPTRRRLPPCTDLGQAHRQGQAMEIDVRNAVARMAVLENAEDEAFPWLHMERAVEKGAALNNLAVD